jgi:hypothetical protein
MQPHGGNLWEGSRSCVCGFPVVVELFLLMDANPAHP